MEFVNFEEFGTTSNNFCSEYLYRPRDLEKIKHRWWDTWTMNSGRSKNPLKLRLALPRRTRIWGFLYLLAFSFPCHGFFRLSQHVSHTNVLRAKKRDLERSIKKIPRAKWNYSINVVYLLYVTAIIAGTIKIT